MAIIVKDIALIIRLGPNLFFISQSSEVILVFKVFMQGDKKYVTMRFYKKLFQSRLWHNGFLLVFTLIGYHNLDKSMRFDEWVLSSFSLVSIFHLYIGLIYGFFRRDIDISWLKLSFIELNDFVELNNFIIMVLVNILFDCLILLFVVLFPSSCQVFAFLGLCCKEKLKLLHVTEFESDEKFCYLFFFCYRIKNSKDSIGKTER